MKLFWKVFMCSLLLSANCMAAEKTDTFTLQIDLKSDKKYFALGENIIVKLKYTNTSSRDAEIEKDFANSGGALSFYAINVTGSEPVKLIAKRVDASQPERNKAVLKSGASLEGECLLNSRLVFPGEGLYLVQAYYNPFSGTKEVYSNIIYLEISALGAKEKPADIDRVMAFEFILNNSKYLKNYWHRDQQGRENIFIEKNATTGKINNLMFYADRAQVVPGSEIKSKGIENYFVFRKFDYNAGGLAIVEYEYPIEGYAGRTVLKKDGASWIELESQGGER